jgi:hypothetical protein
VKKRKRNNNDEDGTAKTNGLCLTKGIMHEK